MKTRLIITVVTTLLSFGFFKEKSLASHAQGMELAYSCLGGNNYVFTLYFYRDCSGISAPTSFFVTINSVSCSVSTSITLPQIGPGEEISSLCTAVASTCQGGSNPGVEQYIYSDTIILSDYCPDWVFSVSECCRNSMVTNLNNASTYELYVESTLDNSDSICNSSPVFTVLPVPYVCINQLSNYNFGAFDPDGDSLVFTLVNPLDGTPAAIPYNLPFTPTYPISTTTGSLAFDSTTGNLSFTPNAAQVCVVAVLVEEYRDDSLIGSIIRDIQVLILNCGTNSQPFMVNNSITGVSGGTQTDSNSVVVCIGSSLSFQLQFSDVDTTDTLEVFSDNDLALPGSFFDTTGINPVNADFSWIPGLGDEGFHSFTVSVQDRACPITGKQTYAFDITVISGTYAGPDIYLCNPDTVQLQATGGGNFLWMPSTGLSDDTIPDPLAYADSTITYTVFSDSSTGCQGNDQITVFVGTDFSLSITQSDTLVCAGESLVLTAQPVPAGSYTFSWVNSPWLSDLNISNPTATPPDTATFTVNVISSTGCLKTASVTINVNDNPITVNPAVSDNLVCKGTSAELFANASSSLPYTLEWYDSGNNLVSTADSFLVTPAGSETYTLTGYSNGCTDMGSVMIDVMAVSAGADTSVCTGNSVQMNAVYYGPLGSVVPSFCGPSAGCNGTGGITDYIAGTDITTNTNTSWPAPYGNWYKNARHQMLYTASELNALGIAGGTITALAFDVTQINGTTDYFSYTIKMGCTSTSALATWESGLTTVFSPKTHTVTVGWNVHTLDVPFDWDGISNVVVDICYDNLAQPSYTNNSSSPYTTTAFNSCVYFYSDVTPACPYTGVPTISTFRPNTRFTVCTESLAPAYSWTPTAGLDYPDSANPVATVSATTTYVVTLDNSVCVLTDSVTINAFPGFALSTSSVSSGCGLQDGSATASVSGGSAPFTYLWSDAGSQTTSTATGLPAGSYTVSVTDAGGCAGSAIAAVSDAGAPAISISGTVNASCSGVSDGSATVTASGGNPPYTYLWDALAGGQTTSTATGLQAGIYAVTVSDNLSCDAVTTATVGNNAPPTVGIASVTNVSCSGGNNGQVTATASGGTPPYSYMWSTAQTGSVATGLSSGTYTVTVTDSKTCTGSAIAAITQPPSLAVTTAVTPATCGNNDGGATATAAGGTAPYSYLWNDSTAQSTSSATGLYAGTYTVTITDAKGCTATGTAAVSNASAPAVTVSVSDASSCGTNDGTASANATGGTPPFTYLWSAGSQTTSVATGLFAGVYTVTVTDNNSCFAITSGTVSQPLITISPSADDSVLCNSDTTVLHANVIASQCDQYSLSSVIFSPVAGSGTPVVLTDDMVSPVLSIGFTFNFYCNDYTQFYISSNGFITFDASGTNGCCSGQILPDIALPNDLVALAWEDLNPSLGGTVEYFTTGTAPSRKLIVNFSNVQHFGGGAPVTGQIILYETSNVIEIHSTTIDASSGSHTMGIENQDGTLALAVPGRNSSAWTAANEGYRFSPMNGTYTVVWKDENNITIGTTDDVAVSPDSSTMYIVTVSNGPYCSFTDSIMVNSSPAFTIATSSVNASCGVADGQATVTVTGGTPPYAYSWGTSPVQTTSSATGLFAGTYDVTVSDGLSCASSATVAVSNSGAPAVSVTAVINISCNGGSNGQISTTVSGGAPPYTYSWNTTPPQTGNTATGLTAGTYSLSVTDNNACLATVVQTITQPAPLSSSVSSTDASCSTNDGTATVTVSGSVPPYTYLWNDSLAQTTSSATGLFAGSYTVTFTDANGCTGSATTAVNNVNAPSVTVSVTDVTACGNADGTAAASASGGTPPYSYLWDAGSQTSATATGLAGGTYSVSVTDSKGCMIIGTATVTEPVSVSTFPYVENFDSFNSAPYNSGSPGTPIITLNNGWENDQSDGGQDWAPRSTPTQSTLTGPDYDHTYGNDGNTTQGNYIFIEDNFDNDPVILLSPCFDISSLASPYLGFWYHSYNATDSNQKSFLHIDVYSGGLWSNDVIPAIGPSAPDEWKYKLYSLSSYSGVIKVRFRGDVSNGFPYNDVAIDDFTIYDSLITVAMSGIEPVRCMVYPNPVNDKLAVEIRNASGTGDAHFILCDMFGRTIDYSVMKHQKHEISVAAYQPGIYYYRIKINGEIKNYGKLVIE